MKEILLLSGEEVSQSSSPSLLGGLLGCYLGSAALQHLNLFLHIKGVGNRSSIVATCYKVYTKAIISLDVFFPYYFLEDIKECVNAQP